MKIAVIAILTAVALVAIAPSTVVAQDLLKEVETGCDKELKGFCKDVTPGQGRLLACLYAHGDKLSGSCEYALYDAAVQLERAVAALTYAANECEDELDTVCAGVKTGEGRVVECLQTNADKVSDRCKRALADVGLAK